DLGGVGRTWSRCPNTDPGRARTKPGFRRTGCTASRQYWDRYSVSVHRLAYLESHRTAFEEYNASQSFFCGDYGRSRANCLRANRARQDLPSIAGFAKLWDLQGL